MLRPGIGSKTGLRMGHMSVSGTNGNIAVAEHFDKAQLRVVEPGDPREQRGLAGTVRLTFCKALWLP
jgi:hypothetical protein